MSKCDFGQPWGNAGHIKVQNINAVLGLINQVSNSIKLVIRQTRTEPDSAITFDEETLNLLLALFLDKSKDQLLF